MKLFWRKTLLAALVVALGLASLPFVSVSAWGTDDPKPPQGVVSNGKLEKAWARQLKMYERIGKADAFIERIQTLVDEAESRGKDVSAVTAALDAFSEAVQAAKPVYASMNGIVNSHQGFDANGKVTDPEKAKETVRSMHDKLQEIKTTMNGTGKALHEAIKAFREANPRPDGQNPKP